MARDVAMALIGAALALGVWRDNKEQTIPVTVAEWRGNQEQAAVQPVPRPPPPADLGLQLSAISNSFRELYRLPADCMRQQGKQYVMVLIWGDNATRSIALPLSSGSNQPEQAAP